MKTTKGGKWVSMEDYKKLEAENAGLKKEIDDLNSKFVDSILSRILLICMNPAGRSWKNFSKN